MTLKNTMLTTSILLAGTMAGAGPAKAQGLGKSLKDSFPDSVISGVYDTPLPGIKSMIIDGQLGYASDDGRYLLRGQMVDNTTGQIVGEDTLATYRAEQLRTINENDKIIARPKGKVEHKVIVFVDTNCGYCRSLHEKEESYLAEGIELQYVAYPLGGLGEGSTAMESVWCATDKSAALAAAYAGEKVVATACSNPVSFTYALGQKIGVAGTPAIYSESGHQLGGFVPADKLKADLDSLEAQAP